MGQPYIGEIRIFAGNFAPAGWMFCEGQLVPISENEALFTLIGNYYGGDGQQTFALPDFRGRVGEHRTGNLTLGTMLGSPTMAISLPQLAAHAHLIDLRISAITRLANGTAQLSLAGAPGSSCQLEKSDDLVTWTSLGAVQFTSATQSFTDLNSTAATSRFYRALP